MTSLSGNDRSQPLDDSDEESGFEPIDSPIDKPKLLIFRGSFLLNLILTRRPAAASLDFYLYVLERGFLIFFFFFCSDSQSILENNNGHFYHKKGVTRVSFGFD